MSLGDIFLEAMEVREDPINEIKYGRRAFIMHALGQRFHLSAEEYAAMLEQAAKK